MQCPVRNTEQPEILLEYCRGSLDPVSASVIEHHIAECAECRNFTAAQQTVLAALAELQPEPVSPDFDARLYSRIEEGRNAGWFERLSRSWKPTFPLAAACATAALAVLLLAPSPQPPASPAELQTQITLSVEDVERTLEDVEMLAQFSTQTL